jgi:hypothetical protein
MTMHAVNLLLSKLPHEACLAHQLPGIVKNLLSVAVLCNTGHEDFFFTKLVAKSLSTVKPSCKGGKTPRIVFGKSRLLTTAGLLSLPSTMSDELSSPLLPLLLDNLPTAYLSQPWPTASMYFQNGSINELLLHVSQLPCQVHAHQGY